MENWLQPEQTGGGENKSELEKALDAGIYGVPELKHGEKIRHLGEFRERVIKLLTKEQVADPGIYPEIVHALGDKRACRMIISGDVDYYLTEKYQDLAKKMRKEYSLVHDPEFTGEAGLIVVSNDAVDVESIEVQDRKEKLKRLGVTESIINSAGKKVCSKCLSSVLKADPSEDVNYQEITFKDRFWGEHCPGCH